MKFKDIAPYFGWVGGAIALASTVFSGLYAIGLGLGLFVNQAMAEDIAQQKALEAVIVVQQALNEESEARERADLKLQLDNAFAKARRLDAIQDKSVVDRAELDATLKEVTRILARQAEMDQPPPRARP